MVKEGRGEKPSDVGGERSNHEQRGMRRTEFQKPWRVEFLKGQRLTQIPVGEKSPFICITRWPPVAADEGPDGLLGPYPFSKPAMSSLSPPVHPLDPLSPDEIRAAVALVRQSGRIGERTRFIVVTLQEPPKTQVLNFKAGGTWAREVFMVLLDNASGATHEAVVSLSQKEITSWKHVPGVQPSITLDEFFECEEALKRDAAFQAALRKRGVTNFELIMVDPWSAGNYGLPGDDDGLRLTRALTWLRS